MEWFRCYSEMATDPKLRAVAGRADCRVADVLAVWTTMLCFASGASPRGCLRGWDDHDQGVNLDMSPGTVAAIRAALEGGGRPMIRDGRIVNWERRQPVREDPTAADRQRRRRERIRGDDVGAGAGDAVPPAPKDGGAMPIRPSSVSGSGGDMPMSHAVTHDHAQRRVEESRGEFESERLNTPSVQTTLSLPAAARKPADAGELAQRLIERIGLPTDSRGAKAAAGVVRGWIATGADPETILATVSRLAATAQASGQAIRTLAYCSPAIRDAMAAGSGAGMARRGGSGGEGGAKTHTGRDVGAAERAGARLAAEFQGGF